MNSLFWLLSCIQRSMPVQCRFAEHLSSSGRLTAYSIHIHLFPFHVPVTVSSLTIHGVFTVYPLNQPLFTLHVHLHILGSVAMSRFSSPHNPVPVTRHSSSSSSLCFSGLSHSQTQLPDPNLCHPSPLHSLPSLTCPFLCPSQEPRQKRGHWSDSSGAGPAEQPAVPVSTLMRM